MTTRIAVIGAGHMGRHHARKVAALRDAGGPVALAGVADIAPERARRVAAETGTRAAAAGHALFGTADAAIIAVPTADHFDVARAAVEAGCDVLVEKPIAASPAEAEALVALAARRGRVLRAGSQEWHHPAFQALSAKIQRPRFVAGQRVGPFSLRSADVDVVRDLMIHDLDVLQKLLGEEPVRIDAVGIHVVTDQIDVANARLVFPGGCVATLTASRVSVQASRVLHFFREDGHGAVDFLAPRATVERLVERGGGATGVERETLVLGPEDALARQLREFVSAVEARDTSPESGRAALAALRTAVRVVEAMPAAREIP